MLAVPSLNELCRCMATETGSDTGPDGGPDGRSGVVHADSSGIPSPPTAAARSSDRRDSVGSPIDRA
jgi:hypothetical protein